MSAVLGPLADRYVRPDPAVPFVVAPEPDGLVRAMPIILRLERPPPGRTSVLEAAAAAALAVCLDPRAEPGGEWHDAVALWVGNRIRKIARRARGAHWEAVQALPGVMCEVGGAQVRALLPRPVAEVPRIVSRLQIGGTELEPDEPGPAPAGVPVIWVNASLKMTVGKCAAQVGHASMLYAATHGLTSVPPIAVRDADPGQWARLLADVERGGGGEWAGHAVEDGSRGSAAGGLPPRPTGEGQRHSVGRGAPAPGAGASRDRSRHCSGTSTAVAVRDAGFTEVAPGTITTIVR